jgi:hypothetical protein
VRPHSASRPVRHLLEVTGAAALFHEDTTQQLKQP